MFAMMSLFYAIGCLVMGRLMTKVDKRILISTSFLFIACSIYISGGVSSNPLHTTIPGLAGAGFFYSGCLLPVIPEIMNTMQAQFEINEDKRRRLLEVEDDAKFGLDAQMEDVPKEARKNNITDKTMAMLAISYALGAVTGPILGGWLFGKEGFKFTTFVISMAGISWCFIYALVVFCGDCSLESAASLEKQAEVQERTGSVMQESRDMYRAVGPLLSESRRTSSRPIRASVPV